MRITCFWYNDDVLYEEITERKIKEKGGQSNYEQPLVGGLSTDVDQRLENGKGSEAYKRKDGADEEFCTTCTQICSEL